MVRVAIYRVTKYTGVGPGGFSSGHSAHEPSRHARSPAQALETATSDVRRQLHDIRDNLEHHDKDRQDIELTIREGRLWMLQCRVGTRTGTAALRCR